MTVDRKTACGIVRKLLCGINYIAFSSLIGLLSASRMISRKGTRFVAPVSVLFVITGIFVISEGCFSAFKSIVFAGLIIFGIL